MKPLALTRGQVEAMRAHVDACLPLEACGLLAGKAGGVQKVIPVPNQAQSAVRFRMSPVEQLQAFSWMEANALELVGIFHSHPAGPDGPSPTDIAEATYPVVYLIWSHGTSEWSVKGYWIQGGRVTEAGLDLADGE
jgi:proteasome lid subunit RPN8/RPN11